MYTPTHKLIGYWLQILRLRSQEQKIGGPNQSKLFYDYVFNYCREVGVPMQSQYIHIKDSHFQRVMSMNSLSVSELQDIPEKLSSVDMPHEIGSWL